MDLKKVLFIFVLICIIVFFIFYYIFCVLGNNKSINQDEVVDNRLKKLEEYEANVDILVISNKTQNTYNMDQIVENNSSKFVINSPENIKDMMVEISNGNLKVSNIKINMEKIYENYTDVLNNNLFLNTFINDYKNNESRQFEEDNEIILETKLNNNKSTYIKFKELHLDKKTGLPKELIMKDNTKKTCISIIYNDVKIK